MYNTIYNRSAITFIFKYMKKIYIYTLFLYIFENKINYRTVVNCHVHIDRKYYIYIYIL